MEELLVKLVEAPTLLGHEAPGQAVMRDAFVELGLDPVDVPLDPEALRDHPGASPFSWDVEGKVNVVAAWPPAEPADGRSLVLNGHIDVVSPAPESMCPLSTSERPSAGSAGGQAATTLTLPSTSQLNGEAPG